MIHKVSWLLYYMSFIVFSVSCMICDVCCWWVMCVICDLNYTWCELYYLCSVLYLINAKWYVNCVLCDICRTNNLFVRPFVMMFRLTKGWNLSNVNIILGQSDDWIICELLATRTCNVWCYVLSRICRSIRHHFNRSVTHEPYAVTVMQVMVVVCSWTGAHSTAV